MTPGTRLGPYEITGLIGAGGMGEVFRAIDSRLRREVAVKVLPAGVAGDPDRLARFEQEARAAAALNHPNIVAIYDVGASGRSTYIVSELLAGVSLRERLAEPVPVRKAIEYSLGILSGLAAAHERGIVHRDLKPENVFVTNDGQVKILDFGLAKLARENGAAAQSVATKTSVSTAAGLILGTIGYMAPEQVRGLPSDQRADIFAFGTVLYEMLTGKRAFAGATSADVMGAILTADPPDVPALDSAVPPAVTTVMRRCLEKDPRDRFQSARDVGFALEAVSARSGQTSDRVAVPVRGRQRLGLLAAAAGVIALAAAAAIWLPRTAAPPETVRLTASIVAPPDMTVKDTPAVSPDGRSIAFAAFDAAAVQRLWLRSLDAEEARALPGTEGGEQPFWSPDGRSLGYFTRGKLWRLDLSGGPPRILANVSDPRGGAWSRDNIIVYSADPDGGLSRVSASGGSPSTLTTLNRARQEISHRWPRFLPDGRHVMFQNRIADSALTRYVVQAVAIDGGAVRDLVAAESTGVYAGGRLLFMRAGNVLAQPMDPRTLALSGEPAPVVRNVWADILATAGLVGFDAADTLLAWRPRAERFAQNLLVDRKGAVIERIGPAGAEDVTPSPDGRLIAFARHDVELNIASVWLYDLARRTTTRVTPAENSGTTPVWSPDSRRLVYSVVRAGAFDLYIADLARPGAETLLLHTDGMKMAQSWSRDGGTILFNAVDSKAGVDLYAIAPKPGATPRVFAGGDGDQCCGRFSPDGHWVTYVTTGTTGRPEVVVSRSSGAGETIQVSADGGLSPDWNANGSALYYVAPDNQLMEVKVSMTSAAFKADSPVALFRLPRAYLSGTRVTQDRFYAPLPDGSRFYVTQSRTDARSDSIIHLRFGWAQ